jgi:hypothetical protein
LSRSSRRRTVTATSRSCSAKVPEPSPDSSVNESSMSSLSSVRMWRSSSSSCSCRSTRSSSDSICFCRLATSFFGSLNLGAPAGSLEAVLRVEVTAEPAVRLPDPFVPETFLEEAAAVVALPAPVVALPAPVVALPAPVAALPAALVVSALSVLFVDAFFCWPATVSFLFADDPVDAFEDSGLCDSRVALVSALFCFIRASEVDAALLDVFFELAAAEALVAAPAPRLVEAPAAGSESVLLALEDTSALFPCNHSSMCARRVVDPRGWHCYDLPCALSMRGSPGSNRPALSWRGPYRRRDLSSDGGS